ncbi:MAG: LicD family protein [Lachnospiraceae bacterium]|nr:LicD family protein [Candidatus Colinaster scatohippi]
MLIFNDDFFKEEYRNDFKVTSTMKSAWAAQLEVLNVISDVCNKLGITYYSFWGTLLGAVRHKGFVPWDDDIDIAMKREDYNHFLHEASSLLPDGYIILSAYNEPEYVHPFARVTNSNTIDISEERLKAFHNCPFVIGIDIFPLDYIAEDKKTINMQHDLFEIIKNLNAIQDLFNSETSKSFDKSTLTELENAYVTGLRTLKSSLGIKGIDNRPLENQLVIASDFAASLTATTKGSKITLVYKHLHGIDYSFEDNWFSPITLPFENIDVVVPSGYDKILTELFGDYMTPVIMTTGHNYPFYRNQLDMLHNAGLWLDIDV